MDGLRAVAVAGVVILHLSNTTGTTFDAYGRPGPFLNYVNFLWTAVPVFFAISGFLLFWPWAVAAREDRSQPSVRAYYWHRILRIMPAYWLVLAASLLAFYHYVFSQAGQLVRLVLLQQQLFVNTDIPQASWEPPWGGALSQTWSLATEFQFYLVLPLIAYVLYRLLRARRTGAAVGVLGLLTAVTVAWRIELAGPFDSTGMFGRFWVPAWMAYFAVGMLLAVIAVHVRHSTSRPAALRFIARYPWLFWVAAVGAYVLVSWPLHYGAHPLVEELCVLIICAGLITPVALAPGKGPERLLQRPVMAWLGQISYGVFLWHIFVQLALVRIAGLRTGTLGVKGFLILLPISLGITVLLAWLSYVLVERPVQRKFRMRTGQQYLGRGDIQERQPPQQMLVPSRSGAQEQILVSEEMSLQEAAPAET